MKLKISNKLFWTAKISEAKSEKPDEFLINGTAINETTTRNGHKFVAEELRHAAKTLENKPLLKDHVETIDSIVGRVRYAEYDEREKSVKFHAAIMDDDIKQKIRDGRIQDVSVGALAKNIEEEGSETETVSVIKGLEFVELSLVAVPADPNANFTKSFAHAITEAYTEVKQKAQEEGKMELKELKDFLEQREKQFEEKLIRLEQKFEEKTKPQVEKTSEPKPNEEVKDSLAKKFEDKIKELEARLTEKGGLQKTQDTSSSEKVERIGSFEVVHEKNGSYFVKQHLGNGKCNFTRAKNEAQLEALLR